MNQITNSFRELEQDVAKIAKASIHGLEEAYETVKGKFNPAQETKIMPSVDVSNTPVLPGDDAAVEAVKPVAEGAPVYPPVDASVQPTPAVVPVATPAPVAAADTPAPNLTVQSDAPITLAADSPVTIQSDTPISIAAADVAPLSHVEDEVTDASTAANVLGEIKDLLVYTGQPVTGWDHIYGLALVTVPSSNVDDVAAKAEQIIVAVEGTAPKHWPQIVELAKSIIADKK